MDLKQHLKPLSCTIPQETEQALPHLPSEALLYIQMERVRWNIEHAIRNRKPKLSDSPRRKTYCINPESYLISTSIDIPSLSTAFEISNVDSIVATVSHSDEAAI